MHSAEAGPEVEGEGPLINRNISSPLPVVHLGVTSEPLVDVLTHDKHVAVPCLGNKCRIEAFNWCSEPSSFTRILRSRCIAFVHSAVCCVCACERERVRERERVCVCERVSVCCVRDCVGVCARECVYVVGA